MSRSIERRISSIRDASSAPLSEGNVSGGKKLDTSALQSEKLVTEAFELRTRVREIGGFDSLSELLQRTQYNRKRRHSHLGGISPMALEEAARSAG